MERTISKHFFNSLAFNNINGKYTANFKESVKDVDSLRITSLSIKSFATINNSLVYYLVIDVGTLSGSVFTINTKPSHIAFLITNTGNNLNLSRIDESAVFTKIASQQLYGFGFYLIDQNLSIVNPNDIGWSFSFSLEFIHYKDEQHPFNK